MMAMPGPPVVADAPAEAGVTYVRAVEIAQLITDELGARATHDVRNANAPCYLVMPPDRTRVGFCGWDTTWTVMCLVPGPDNADAYLALDAMVDRLSTVLPIVAARRATFSRTGAEPNLPAYECTFSEVLG